jgi:transposase
MEVLYERCCGLDVHKGTIAACLVTPGRGGQGQKEIRTFGAMTDDILVLRDWLRAAEVEQVAMESTGVYWKPIWNLLEDEFELVLANASQVKGLRGKKTDIKDCEWIADLLRHGLIKSSFVPSREQRELRELTRYRTTLVRERSAELNRLQKTLEGGNIKLAGVVSDLQGKSGRQMLAALAAGTTDGDALAELAVGRLRGKLPELRRALSGRMGPHQSFMLTQQLAHIDALDATIAAVAAEIEERMRPFATEVEHLDSIPGVGQIIANGLLAELGPDMSKFPTASCLASWAKICPGNNESAGKRRSGKTGRGDRWLRNLLTEAGHAAAKTPTYLGSQYHRLAGRIGKKKAAVAVGHSILIIAYHLLRDGHSFTDLGYRYFDQRDATKLRHRLVHRLQGLGYRVTLETA